MHGHAAANYSIQEADLIIALGQRFDDRTIGTIKTYAPKAHEAYLNKKGGIIHVNNDCSEIKKVIKSNYNFEMDCNIFLKNIINHIKFNKREKWINNIMSLKDKHKFKNDNTMKTHNVINCINKYLPQLKNDFIITTGVGNHQMMAAQYIKYTKPKSWVTSGSLGVMGAGLPYAIGAQIADKNKVVIDIDGDGSFNQTLSELITIKKYNLPVKIAIMNDGYMSMVKTWEKLFFDERYVATDLPSNPEYHLLAESCGIKGIVCDSYDDLDNKVKQFLSYDEGPILCNFKVNSDICLPLVAPGKGLDDMILNNSNISIDGNIAPS